MADSATFQDAANSMTPRGRIAQALAPYARFLPFGPDDVLRGTFDVLVENTADVMIPLRAVAGGLREVWKTMRRDQGYDPESLLPVEHFVSDLGRMVTERHHLDKPDIFRITPGTVSSAFLERLIEKDEVHKIKDTNDLATRLYDKRRAIYAWRDPYDADGALITVQVAFTEGMASNINKVISATDFVKQKANTATPYSISNWGQLNAVGRPFIQAVAEEICRENPAIKQVVTLSPMRGFADWASEKPLRYLGSELAQARLAASYVLNGKETSSGYRLRNPTADFHLGNGAVLERVCRDADPQDNEALGFMANYRYPSRAVCESNSRNFRNGYPARSKGIDLLLNA